MIKTAFKIIKENQDNTLSWNYIYKINCFSKKPNNSIGKTNLQQIVQTVHIEKQKIGPYTEKPSQKLEENMHNTSI
jgi:hypothetical protein